MSFRCAECKKSPPARTPPVVRVVRTRSKTYPPREIAKGLFRRTLDKGGEGYEVVREVQLCPQCALNPNAGHGK